MAGPSKKSTLSNSATTSPEDYQVSYPLGGDGILRLICPVCGYIFKYKRGRTNSPRIYEVNRWLDKARCPDCGILVNLHLKRQADKMGITPADQNKNPKK